MRYPNVTVVSLLAVSIAASAVIACGSDDTSPADAVYPAGGGGSSSRGGAPASGGSSTALGGRSVVATGGQTASSSSCIQGATCRANCTATCPDLTSGREYQCTCADGRLDCDMGNCENGFTTPICAANVANGVACVGTSDAICNAATGNTFCFCDADANKWTCL